MSGAFWIDGRMVPASEARIAPDDLGFTVGLAVFETLLWEAGHLDFVDRHMARMETGARALAIEWPPRWDPRAALAEFAATLDSAPRAVRATLTRGSAATGGRCPTLVIGSRGADAIPEAGVLLELSHRALTPQAAGSAIKSTNRIDYWLAREEAVALGAWDALLPTTDGDLAEATVANLFAVIDRVLVTPPLERGCLGGVMRGLVLETLARALPASLREVREGRLEPADLEGADEVFLTNTTGRVIGVREIAGLGRFGVPGPVAVDVRGRIAELEREDRASTGP